MDNPKLFVLLIEDSDADARLVKEMLRTEPDIDLHRVERMAAGIDYLASQHADIVLLDLGLPDSQGLDSLHAMIKAAPHLPVIVITGQEDLSLAQKAIQHGAQDYIIKPVLSGLLFVRILHFAYERNKVDIALKKSEAKYRRLHESMRDGFVYVDMQGRICDCNESYRNMLGYSFEELTRLTYQDLTPDKWHAYEQGIVNEQILPKGYSEVYEKEYRRKDGRIFPVELRTLLLKKETGENEGMWAVVRDITERKRSEKILELRVELVEYSLTHSLTELMQAALDEICALVDSPIGFYHSVETDEKTLSQQAWSGRTASEVCAAEGKGMNNGVEQAGVWVDCLIERKPVIHNDAASLPHRKDMPDSHATVIRELAVPVWRENRIVAILGVGNKPDDYGEEDIRTLSFLGDVTWEIARRKLAEESLLTKHKELATAHAELKRAQAQVIQQEKLASIGQLAAGITHEINNPMSFITGNLGILQTYIDGITETIKAQDDIIRNQATPEAVESLSSVRKKNKVDFILRDIGNLVRQSLDGADRIKRIVADLKSFSRMGDDILTIEDINFGLNSTINIVWNEIKYKAELVKEFGELPLTRCNISRLNQVFMNLLVNAAQAIDKKGKIITRTWAKENNIYVSVEDTGSGIDEENMTRIFDPFFTTKEAGRGTGLGLSISYDIVKRHNGDIMVKSEVGRGTTFTVRIPVVRS